MKIKSLDVISEMKKNVIKLKAGQVIYPLILDIHPVMNCCNLNCAWCIGGGDYDTKIIHKMQYDDIEPVYKNIFQEKEKENWPMEIHFCGNNSEPLLNRDFIQKSIENIAEKTRIKIITNGILLDQYNDIIHKVNKINISLDVVSSEDFIKYKGGKKGDYDKIIQNINHIKELKKRFKYRTPVIYTSFVISSSSFDYDKFEKQCRILRDVGVNHIQVRKDYFNQSLKMSFVKHKVIEIAKRLGAYNENIVYGLEDENTFDIKFNERTDRISLNSMICKSFWFWPTIAANGWIYSCAHKANENSEHLNVHLEELKDYYNCIRKRTQEKMEFSCDTPQLCPSNLNYINSLFF